MNLVASNPNLKVSYNTGINLVHYSLQANITSPKHTYTCNFNSLLKSGNFMHFIKVSTISTCLLKDYPQALAISAMEPMADLKRSPSIYFYKAWFMYYQAPSKY